jgi:hypothetical protein
MNELMKKILKRLTLVWHVQRMEENGIPKKVLYMNLETRLRALSKGSLGGGGGFQNPQFRSFDNAEPKIPSWT